MPSTSSVGWLGCRRVENVPRRPATVLHSLSTWILWAAYTRSRLLMILATPATISAVMPRVAPLMSASVVS